MREIFSFIFEQVTDPLALPFNPMVELIVLAIIHRVVFKLAFKTVGELYDGGAISGKGIGSFIHWSIRLVSFVVIWVGINGVIIISRFIIKNWITVTTVAGGALILVVIFFFVRWRIR